MYCNQKECCCNTWYSFGLLGKDDLSPANELVMHCATKPTRHSSEPYWAVGTVQLDSRTRQHQARQSKDSQANAMPNRRNQAYKTSRCISRSLSDYPPIYVCVLGYCVPLTLCHMTFLFSMFCLPCPAEERGLPLVSRTLC